MMIANRGEQAQKDCVPHSYINSLLGSTTALLLASGFLLRHFFFFFEFDFADFVLS